MSGIKRNQLRRKNTVAVSGYDATKLAGESKTLERHRKEYIVIRGFLDHDFFFVNIDNTPMKVRTMQQNIQAHGIAAAIKGVRVSPHTFRHTGAKMYVMDLAVFYLAILRFFVLVTTV